MELFGRVNAIYGSFFGISPPARACVGVDLSLDIRVKLDCIAFIEETTQERQSLHVQSLSYWAPANIGPYSQAITVRRPDKKSLVSRFNDLISKGRRANIYIRPDWHGGKLSCPPFATFTGHGNCLVLPKCGKNYPCH